MMTPEQFLNLVNVVDEGMRAGDVSAEFNRTLSTLVQELQSMNRGAVARLTAKLDDDTRDRLANAVEAFRAGLTRLHVTPQRRKQEPVDVNNIRLVVESKLFKDSLRELSGLARTILSEEARHAVQKVKAERAKEPRRTQVYATPVTDTLRPGRELLVKPEVAYGARVQRGVVTPELVSLLGEVMRRVPAEHRPSLVGYSAKKGFREGYHSIYEAGLFGNLMHMMQVGRMASELTQTRGFTKLKDIPKAVEALQLAGGLHDIFKYMRQGAGQVYDPGHGLKAARLLETQFRPQLDERFGVQVANQIIDAIGMHHFSPTRKRAERALREAEAEGKTGVAYWGAAQYKDLGTIDRFRRYRELTDLGVPDIAVPTTKAGPEWQRILQESSMEQLQEFKARQDALIVKALKEADIQATRDVKGLLAPDDMFALLRGGGLLDQHTMEQFQMLSTEQKQIVAQHFGERLTGLFAGGYQNLDQLNVIFEELGISIPAMINALLGPLDMITREAEGIRNKIDDLRVNPDQLASIKAQIRDSLTVVSRAKAPVAEETFGGQGRALQALGFRTQMYQDPQDMLDRFLVSQGDLMELFSQEVRTLGGASFVEDVRSLGQLMDRQELSGVTTVGDMREAYTNLVSELVGLGQILTAAQRGARTPAEHWKGIDPDLMRAMMVNPATLNPIIESLRARTGTEAQEQAQLIETMRGQYLDIGRKLQAELTDEHGLINLNELFYQIAQRSGVRPPPDVAEAEFRRHEALIGQRATDPMRHMDLSIAELETAREIQRMAGQMRRLEGFETDLPRELVPATWREDMRALIAHFQEFGVVSSQNLERAQALMKLLMEESRAAGFTARAIRPLPTPEEQALEQEILRARQLGQVGVLQERLARVPDEFAPAGLRIDRAETQKLIDDVRAGVPVLDRALRLHLELTKVLESQAQAAGVLVKEAVHPDRVAAQEARHLAQVERLQADYMALPEHLKTPVLTAGFEELSRSMETAGKASDFLVERLRALTDLQRDRAQREGVQADPTLADQWAVRRRLVGAQGVLEAQERFAGADPAFTSRVTVQELAELQAAFNRLNRHVGAFTPELIEQSRAMEPVLQVLRAEHALRQANTRVAKEEQAAIERVRREKLRELATPTPRAAFHGGGGFRGGGGFDGGFGGFGGGFHDMPMMMGGGGQAGWIMRQMMWQIAGPIIQTTSLYALIRQATTAITQQETAVINLRRVFSGLADDLYILSKNITRMAVEFGAALSEVGKIQEMWAQTGKDTAQQIEELTKVTLLAINTSDINKADEAVRFLNSSIQQMGLGWEDSLALLDSWNKVADRFPAFTKDFAEGYARSASYARALKMDIHELNAVIAVLVERTGRTGAEVSTALRMIFANVHRPRTLNVLQDMGIDPFVEGSTTQLRPFMDLMNQAAELFDRQAASEQGAAVNMQRIILADALGQARRRNFALALLDAWERVAEVMEVSADSAGYSAKKMELTMGTLAFKGRQLAAAFQETAVSFGDSGLVAIMKTLIDAGTSVLNVFNALPSGIRESISWFLMLGGVLSTLNTLLYHTAGAGLSTRLADQLGLFRNAAVVNALVGVGTGRVVGRVGEAAVAAPEFQTQVREFLAPPERGGLNEAMREQKELSAQLAVEEAELAKSKEQVAIATLAHNQAIQEEKQLLAGSTDATQAATAADRQKAAGAVASTAATKAEALAIQDATAKKVANTKASIANAAARAKEAAAAMAAATAQALASAGLTLVIAGLVAGVAWLFTYRRAQQDRINREKEELRQLREKHQKVENIIETQDELVRRERELLAVSARTSAQQGELERVQRELNKSYEELAKLLPEAGTRLDEYGNVVAEVTEHTREWVRANEAVIASRLELAAITAQTEAGALEEEETALETRIAQARARHLELLEQAAGLGEGARTARIPQMVADPLHGTLITGYISLEEAIEEVTAELAGLYEEHAKVQEALGKGRAAIEAWNLYRLREENAALFEQMDALQESGNVLSETLKGLSAETTEDLAKEFETLGKAIDVVSDGFAKGQTGTHRFIQAHKLLIKQLSLRIRTDWRDDQAFLALSDPEQDRKVLEEAERIVRDSAALRKWYEDLKDADIDRQFERLGEQERQLNIFRDQARREVETLDLLIEARQAALVASRALTLPERILGIDLREFMGEGISEERRKQLEDEIKGLEEQRKLIENLIGGLEADWEDARDAVFGMTIGRPDGGEGPRAEPYERLKKSLAATDHALRQIRGRIELLDETWRNHTKSTLYVETKTRLLRQEQTALIRAIGQTKSELAKLNQNKGAHGEKIRELQTRYQDLNKQHLANVNSLHELSKALRELNAEAHKKRIDEFDRRLQDADLTLKILSAGSKEGAQSFRALNLEASRYSTVTYLTNRKIAETRAEIDRLTRELNKNRAALDKAKPGTQAYANAAESVEYFTQQLLEANNALGGLISTNLDATKNITSFVSGLLTEGYRRRLDAELEKVDALIEAENKRHTQFVENRRKELEILQRGWAEEDFNEAMNRLREEEAHLWAQFRRIELDDTQWAETKRADLMVQIRAKQHEIAEKAEAKQREDTTQRIEDEISEEEKKSAAVIEEHEKTKVSIQEKYDAILRTVESKTAGIVEAWRRSGFSITALLRALVPEIGQIGAEQAAAWNTGFNLGMATAREEAAQGTLGTPPGAPPTAAPTTPRATTPTTPRATTPTTPRATTPTTPTQRTHTVATGDTLWGLARANPVAGVSTNQRVDQIYQANRAAIDAENRRRGADTANRWLYPGQRLTIPGFLRGGIVPHDGLVYAHEEEMVLPAKYRHTIESLAHLIKLPRPTSPGWAQQIIENEISVQEAIHIENAYFKDELDLSALEERAGRELKKSLKKRGVRLA